MGELHAKDPNRVGPFELRGRLGAGGMGQVYLGQAPDGRLVAVKVVHDGLASDPQFRARFAREIEHASRVRAPWAAEVIATDPDAARPWLACEYITGPSLEQAITVGGPLAEPTLLVLAARLASALSELHAMGVLHRDLKPSNVLLAEDGPKLIDFGIAKALDATRMTSTGMTMSTPAFMSPEQANGDSETFASDVFSLAAVLVFAATGQGPFGPAATPVAMLKRIINDPPELAGVPERLRSELEPCLAKQPDIRPDAATMAHRLTMLADSVPGHMWPSPELATMVNRTRLDLGELVGPPVTQAESARPTRSKWLVAGLLATLVLGGGAIAVGTVVSANPETEYPSVPSAPPKVINVPLIPSVVPGWTPVVSTARNAAYDVPQDWRYAGPDSLRGFDYSGGVTLLMSGVGEHGTLRCPGAENPDPNAWAGITGADGRDAADAADSAARAWALIYEEHGQQPVVTPLDAHEVNVAGRQGSHVAVTVTKPAGACGTPTAVVHTVALPANDGLYLVWVLLAEGGVVPEADLQQMISTIRPAGLEWRCNRSRPADGNWC